MKNILFTLILLLSLAGFRNLKAQSLLKNTIPSAEGEYTFEAKKDIDGFFTFTLKDTKTDSSAQFSIKPLMKNSFVNGFVTSRLKLIPKEMRSQKIIAQQLETQTKVEANMQLFEVFVANQQPDPSEPVAGNLSIIDTIPILRMYSGASFVKKMMAKDIKKHRVGKKEWRNRLADARRNFETQEALNNPESLIQARNEYLQVMKDAAESRILKELKFEEALEIKMKQSEEELAAKHQAVEILKAQILFQKRQKQVISHSQKLCQNNILESDSITKTYINQRFLNLQSIINQRLGLRNDIEELERLQVDSNVKATLLRFEQEKLQSLVRDSVRLATDTQPDLEKSVQILENENAILKQRKTSLELEVDLKILSAQKAGRQQSGKNKRATLVNLVRDSSEIENKIADEAIKKNQLLPILQIEKSKGDSLDSLISRVYLRLKEAEHAEQFAYADRPKREMAVEYVQLEFHDGYIENIVVFGHLVDDVDEKLKFENVYPIGFSTKKNFEQLETISLYEHKLNVSYRMKLGKLLAMYEQNHSSLSKDYSPKNQVITVCPPDKNLTLTKEPTNKLLEAQVFTDLIGFGELNPNGLVQTHITRKIPIRTRRFSFIGDYRNINFGYLSYVEPTVVFSKFEEKIRYLNTNSLDFVINNALFSQKYTSTIRTKEYENFSTGLDLNAVLLDFPNFKSTIFCDFGFRYGRTAFQDSIRILSQGVIQTSMQEPNNYVVKTYQLYPKFIWKIMPDERYGFSLSYQWNFFSLRDNRVKQVSNEIEFRNGITSRHLNWFETFQLGGFFKPDKDSDNKFFFRYIFHHQRKQWKLNFDQAQLGYSFFINVTRKAK